MGELGLCSRREAERWITNGWVKVDGQVVDQLGTRVSPDAKIEIDRAARDHQNEQVTILLHKPVGYVSGQAEDGYEPAIVLIRLDFFLTVLRARTNTSRASASPHFEVYSFVPDVLSTNPFLGLGLNNFAVYYEFVTGRPDFGPHSFYVATLVETGLLGAALFAVFVLWLFRRLGAARRIGRALSAAGDPLDQAFAARAVSPRADDRRRGVPGREHAAARRVDGLLDRGRRRTLHG